MPSFKNQRHAFRSSDSGQILPLKRPDTRLSSTVRTLPKRCFRLVTILFLSSWAFLFLYTRHPGDHSPLRSEEKAFNHSLPPLYEAYHDFERHLPQHDLSLPFPEGRDAKFFWAPNHVWASGWGNVMQELLVNALLAHETNRAFVFDNFTWDRGESDYSEFNGRLIPSRIPLSAIISGPIIGSAFEAGDPTPRSVSQEYFKKVCPEPTIIDTANVSAHLRYDGPASQIFDLWADTLNSINDPCVEIHRDSFQLFEIWLFGSTRILSLWPRLSKSPILRNFSWSPLVLEAFSWNADLFGITTTKPSRFFPSYFRPSAPPTAMALHNVEPLLPATKVEPIPGLLVLHIRRGDFAGHCSHLANWASDWNGFNKFAAFPDKFRPPPNGGNGNATEEDMQMYLQRCFPTIEQIVEKVREVLADQKRVHGTSKELKRIYVMTNGDVAWLEELRQALLGIKVWEAVTTSRDLKLSWEVKPVAQAVDMLVGQRAQVFIGNGFSSLTSNVAMFRVLKDLPPGDTRFW